MLTLGLGAANLGPETQGISIVSREIREQAIAQLEEQIAALRKVDEAERLLEEVWLELGPYTAHLSKDLRYKLQDYFKFDDSE